MAEKKSDLRKYFLEKREELTEDEREKAAFLVTERLLGHQWFYRASHLLCFASFGSEIDSFQLIEEALRLGKKVFLPRVEERSIVFYHMTSLDQLTQGKWGILEPDGRTERFTMEGRSASDVLMIMPGVVFDRWGNRMGYGGGYYDRYLSDPANLGMHTIAIGFACQETDSIPVEAWDVRPGQVILR